MADAARFGITLDPALLSRPDQTGVWPDNADAVKVFLLLDTQWRVQIDATGRSLPLGLDYAGARAGLDMLAITVTPDLWQSVMIIESAAKAAWIEALQ